MKYSSIKEKYKLFLRIRVGLLLAWLVFFILYVISSSFFFLNLVLLLLQIIVIIIELIFMYAYFKKEFIQDLHQVLNQNNIKISGVMYKNMFGHKGFTVSGIGFLRMAYIITYIESDEQLLELLEYFCLDMSVINEKTDVYILTPSKLRRNPQAIEEFLKIRKNQK